MKLKNRDLDTSLVDKAIIYAVTHHKNTRRKGKNIPYILHPLEAMGIVATITDDQELIAAAALHDLIEDTDVTYDDIYNEFGKRIADIVLSESNNAIDNYEDLSWHEIREKTMEKLKKASIDSKIVALGDKLSNMRAIYTDHKILGEKLWLRFNEKNPKEHKWRYVELTKCFDELQDTNAYKEFRNLVSKVFDGIE
jgi:(p)ppGpp synthase/HD superfamily hydrolase